MTSLLRAIQSSRSGPKIPYKTVGRTPLAAISLRTHSVSYTHLVSTHTTTLTHRGPWADRLRAALLKLQSPYVLMIRDDFFLCSPVNQEVVSYALDHFTSRTAGFIFSRSVSDSDYDSDVWGFKVDVYKRQVWKLVRNASRHCFRVRPSRASSGSGQVGNEARIFSAIARPSARVSAV